MQNKHDFLDVAVKSLSQKLRQSLELNKQLKNGNAALLSQIESLQQDIDSFRKENEKLKAENELLRQNIDPYHGEACCK